MELLGEDKIMDFCNQHSGFAFENCRIPMPGEASTKRKADYFIKSYWRIPFFHLFHRRPTEQFTTCFIQNLVNLTCLALLYYTFIFPFQILCWCIEHVRNFMEVIKFFFIYSTFSKHGKN